MLNEFALSDHVKQRKKGKVLEIIIILTIIIEIIIIIIVNSNNNKSSSNNNNCIYQGECAPLVV